MLHSTLPRAFATPGLKYLGGYYGEDPLSYPVPGSLYPEEHFYPGISSEHHAFPAWHAVQRPPSPCPLDLSLKPTRLRPDVVDIEDPAEEEGYKLLMTPQHHLHAPMTPPSTPSPPQCPRKRTRDPREDASSKPSMEAAGKPRGKKKHARRLKFDEDTSSPVSGTVILGPDEAVVTGDIDPAFNVVEVTEEARAELAKIENRLGPYQCRLCRQLHEDAFQLAQHRCSRIAHVEYRCPECDKRFSCPANLASHRRWHKPRVPPGETPSTVQTQTEFLCSRCDAKFSRQAALRKHVASQHQDSVSTGSTGSTGSTASCSSQLAVSPLTVEVAP